MINRRTLRGHFLAFLSSTNLETAASAFRCSDSTFKIPSRSCAVEILCLFFREIDLSLLFFIILNKIIICKPKSSPATLRSIRYDFFKGSKKNFNLYSKEILFRKKSLWIKDGQWDWDPMEFLSRDLEQGLGLIIFRRFWLRQISLGQSRDKNLWDSQISSFGVTWDSSPMGFNSPMGPIEIFRDLCLGQGSA